MTVTSSPDPVRKPGASLGRWLRNAYAPGLAVVGVAAAAGLTFGLGRAAPHLPDLAPILKASPVIRLHLAAAAAAVGLGAVQMLAPKGSLPHRTIGWVWVMLMMTTAASSIFIKVIHPGHFSLIHFLSGWVLLVTPLAVIAARRGKIAAHGRAMAGLFYLGLVTAGAFTFLPGRLMFQVFFGH